MLNHVSWLDIVLVNAARPMTFIAKAEIARWPLVGTLVTRAGTLYIERGSRAAVRRTNRHLSQALEEGALVACFPAGTVSGAPKVRAMEIIDALEPERRGPYSGAIGYVAYGDRRMDLAITIRTCVIAGGEASVSAGAGIVADSVPEREWAETEAKARAMLTAIGRARAATLSGGVSGAP